MNLGGGFLKQMNDSMKYNRDLLGKRKSVREMYKDEIKNRETRHEHQSLEHVRERVAISLRRNRIAEVISRVLAIAAIIAFVVGAVWVLLNADFSVRKKAKYHNKNALFKTVIYH